jgi:hypothetical protein
MNKRKNFALTILLLFSIVAHAPAQQPAELRQPAAQIAGSVLVGGRSMEYLQKLTDKFGGRLTGSRAYQRSAEWAAEEFRAMGIKNVKLEPFTIPSGWERGSAHGRMVSPMDRVIHIESLGWAPSTPAGGRVKS